MTTGCWYILAGKNHSLIYNQLKSVYFHISNKIKDKQKSISCENMVEMLYWTCKSNNRTIEFLHCSIVLILGKGSDQIKKTCITENLQEMN